MGKILIKLFKEATDIFFVVELQNILNGVAERNLCGRLAIHLTNKLNEHGITGYYADPEYNRKQDGKVKTILDDEMEVVPIQCDLIVHSRGNNIKQDNLIAIEMKKSNRPEAERKSDRKRLRALTKDSYDNIWSYDGIAHPEHVCGYLYGIYMILDIRARTCLFEYYQKGNKVGERTECF
ncbi:MAG: hypothetical protein RI980_665 [Bacteroidota bacterium]|jgi:hypothetical protein